MWTLIWILVTVALVVLLMAFSAKFLGKGHLDVPRSTNHYLGEIETWYHIGHP